MEESIKMIKRNNVFKVKISLLAIKPISVITKKATAPIIAPTKKPRLPIFLEAKKEVTSVPTPKEMVANSGENS